MKLRLIGILLALSLLVSCSPKYEGADNNIYNSSSNSPIATKIVEQQSTPMPAVIPSISNTPTQRKSVPDTKSTVKNNSVSNNTQVDNKEVTTSGNNVSVPDAKEPNIKDDLSTTSTEKKEITVYVTKTGDKYHASGCSYLRKSCIPKLLSDAKSSGYTPCSRCHPPQ